MVSEERLMVLTMLQEGKISSDEASKLLQALDELEIEEELQSCCKTDLYYDEDNDMDEQIPNSEERYTGFIHDKNEYTDSSAKKVTTNKIEALEKKLEKKAEKMERLSESLDKEMDTFGQKMDDWGENFGEDFGEKMGAWGESFGEKMGNWGENFGEKMGKVGEELAESATSLSEKVLKMVDSFIGDGSFGIFPGSYENINETIDRNILNIDSPILEIHGTNGKIILHSWEEDNIRIKARCSIKKSIYDKSQSVYEVMEQNNKLVFKPRYTNGIGTSLEIYVPSKEYEKIFLLTSNGRIEADKINTKELILDTTNGSIKTSNISSNRIIACSNNGTITTEYIDSKKIELETSNATINVQGINCENIIATTKNGRIAFMDVQSKEMILTSSNASLRVEDCMASSITAKTSNGSIKVSDIETSTLRKIETYTSNSSIEMKIDDYNKAYNIDAQTSMGKIDVEIPNLIYDLNKQNSPGKQKILAHSAYNTEIENQINLIASTSNGSIKII